MSLYNSTVENLVSTLKIDKKELSNIISNSRITESEWILDSNLKSWQLNEIFKFYRVFILDGIMPIGSIVMFDITMLNNKVSVFNMGNTLGTNHSFFELVKILRSMKFMIVDEHSSLMFSIDFSAPINSINFQKKFKILLALTHSEKIIPLNENNTLRLNIYVKNQRNISLLDSPQSSFSQSQNAKLYLSNQKFMKPIPSYHNLSEYIDILRIDGNRIIHSISKKVILENYSYLLKKSICSILLKEETEISSTSADNSESNMSFYDVFKLMYKLAPEYKRQISYLQNYVQSINEMEKNLRGLQNHFKQYNTKDKLILKLSTIKGITLLAAEGLVNKCLFDILEGTYLNVNIS